MIDRVVSVSAEYQLVAGIHTTSREPVCKNWNRPNGEKSALNTNDNSFSEKETLKNLLFKLHIIDQTNMTQLHM